MKMRIKRLKGDIQKEKFRNENRKREKKHNIKRKK